MLRDKQLFAGIKLTSKIVEENLIQASEFYRDDQLVSEKMKKFRTALVGSYISESNEFLNCYVYKGDFYIGRSVGSFTPCSLEDFQCELWEVYDSAVEYSSSIERKHLMVFDNAVSLL